MPVSVGVSVVNRWLVDTGGNPDSGFCQKTIIPGITGMVALCLLLIASSCVQPVAPLLIASSCVELIAQFMPLVTFFGKCQYSISCLFIDCSRCVVTFLEGGYVPRRWLHS